MVTGDPMASAARDYLRALPGGGPAAVEQRQALHLAFCAGWQARTDGLLTGEERDAIRLAGDTADAVGAIIRAGGSRETRPGDWAEIAAAVHVVQRAVAANVAARAFPALFRPLGGEIQA